jgi:hypothetical protein
MSLRAYMSSIPPPVVAAAGAAVLSVLPLALAATATSSLVLLKSANVAAFALNCVAVSVPGRIDGEQDQDMWSGDLDPSKPATTRQSETTPLSTHLHSREYHDIYSPARGRTLVSPSGWAFAIWGPIYLGETIFVAAQFFPQSGLAVVLPEITAPFVAANIFQSLWCASFRPNYRDWASYISVAMLAGTAYSLSQVHAISCTTQGPEGWFLLLLTVHFGWTSAATLVNLSGSVAMNPSNSDSVVTAVGHSSALLATILGVGVTLIRSDPAFGFTLAWALTACADGMKKRVTATDESSSLKTAAQVQNKLCWAGAAACAAASVSTYFL